VTSGLRRGADTVLLGQRQALTPGSAYRGGRPGAYEYGRWAYRGRTVERHVHLRFRMERPIVTTVTLIDAHRVGSLRPIKTDVDEFQDIANPFVTVAVAYPGESPQQVERESSTVMEEPVQRHQWHDQITSTAPMGCFAQITDSCVQQERDKAQSKDVRDARSRLGTSCRRRCASRSLKKLRHQRPALVSLASLRRTLTPPEP